MMDTVQQLGSEQDSSQSPFDFSDKDEQSESQKVAESTKSYVKKWLERIDQAEKKYEKDFDRMRDNMDFVWGLQWNGQKGITYDKYVANWTIRAVNQGVATLYARNPQVEVKRNTNRMNYRLWDGKIETIQQIMAIMSMAQANPMLAAMLPPDIIAMWQDFQQGRQREGFIDRVSETLQKLIQNQLSSQVPDFKTQMKQLVRRVNVCGVGYIKTNFCREEDYMDSYGKLTQSPTRLSPSDRLKMVKHLLSKVEDDKFDSNAPELEQIKNLIESLDEHPLDSEMIQIKEKIELDFLRATSIIPDPKCRTLKGFVGAHWVVEKMFFVKSYIEGFYEIKLEEDESLKTYDMNNQPDEGRIESGSQDKEQKQVCVYVVHNLDEKSEFTICRGYKNFLCEPEAVTPCPRNFWKIVPVTFNDVEVEEGCDATIFPPSLVDLIKPAQKEWNRIRYALGRHRKANGPKYPYINGTLEDADLDRISNAEDQEFVKITGAPPGTDPSKLLAPLGSAEIRKEVYDAEPIREDSLLVSGQQEANQGPPQPNITATGVHVAEQSRMGVAASDIDGLDDSLTAVATCMMELNLMEISSQTVQHIVGIGAILPDDPTIRRDLLDEVDVTVKAGSSGKPNQALKLNTWQTISQILLQFGANPQPVIRETIKEFDRDDLEPTEFFPVQPPMPPPGAQQPVATANNRPPQGRRPMPPGRNQPKPSRIPQQPQQQLNY